MADYFFGGTQAVRSRTWPGGPCAEAAVGEHQAHLADGCDSSSNPGNPMHCAFNLGSSVWSVIQMQARTMFATGLGIARV